MVQKKDKNIDINPEDFEEPKLPTKAPLSPEEEFADIDDIETGFESLPFPSKEMILAKQKLEKKLLFDVIDKALSADSGTNNYGFENISGVGISEKITDGKSTGELSITVYVVVKRLIEMILKEALVPEEVDGIPTDVKAVGELRTFPHFGKYRPAPGGVSIGHIWGPCGTLGCLVKKGNRLYILSNNHVLARSNYAIRGAPIIQPCCNDGGTIKDTIALLSDFVRIKYDGPVNYVDAAIAQTSPKLVTKENICFDNISTETVPGKLEMLVKKCGRTSQEGITGKITDLNWTGWIGGYGFFGFKKAIFQNQIVVNPYDKEDGAFALPGDSGSLVITEEGNRPVGLLFAGNEVEGYAIVNPINAVLEKFKVTIYA